MSGGANPKVTTTARSEGARKRAKRPYVRPQLVAFGSVTKLTQGGGGSKGDGATMDMA
jgi:hypothetical protein